MNLRRRGRCVASDGWRRGARVHCTVGVEALTRWVATRREVADACWASRCRSGAAARRWRRTRDAYSVEFGMRDCGQNVQFSWALCGRRQRIGCSHWTHALAGFVRSFCRARKESGVSRERVAPGARACGGSADCRRSLAGTPRRRHPAEVPPLLRLARVKKSGGAAKIRSCPRTTPSKWTAPSSMRSPTRNSESSSITGTSCWRTRVARCGSSRIRILLGDRVRVEMSPYDLTRGRISYRYR